MSANLQPVFDFAERMNTICTRIDGEGGAVEKAIIAYSSRTDVRLDWHKYTPEFRTLSEALNAYALGWLTENEIKPYFQAWVKSLEVAAPRPARVMRLVPQTFFPDETGTGTFDHSSNQPDR